MKKKGIGMAVACILGITLAGAGIAKADYYEHHIDWQGYCMQAKDVTVTEEQKEEWVQDGVIEEKFTEESQLLTREFRESNWKEPWLTYEGTYYVDIGELNAMRLEAGETSKETSVTFYIDENDKDKNYISVNVKLISEAGESGSKGEAESEKILGGIALTSSNVLNMFTAANIVLTMTALAGFSISIYSDFKVLYRYKLMLRKRREGRR